MIAGIVIDEDGDVFRSVGTSTLVQIVSSGDPYTIEASTINGVSESSHVAAVITYKDADHFLGDISISGTVDSWDTMFGFVVVGEDDGSGDYFFISEISTGTITVENTVEHAAGDATGVFVSGDIDTTSTISFGEISVKAKGESSTSNSWANAYGFSAQNNIAGNLTFDGITATATASGTSGYGAYVSIEEALFVVWCVSGRVCSRPSGAGCPAHGLLRRSVEMVEEESEVRRNNACVLTVNMRCTSLSE